MIMHTTKRKHQLLFDLIIFLAFEYTLKDKCKVRGDLIRFLLKLADNDDVGETVT